MGKETSEIHMLFSLEPQRWARLAVYVVSNLVAQTKSEQKVQTRMKYR
jgi:hypothetical protein